MYQYKQEVLKDIEETIDTENFLIFAWSKSGKSIEVRNGLSVADTIYFLEMVKLKLLNESLSSSYCDCKVN